MPLSLTASVGSAVLLLLLATACGGSDAPPQHTVTAVAESGGTISPTSTRVDHGKTTTFTVTANTGYLIAGVTGCGGALSGGTFTTGAITADCKVTATFVAQHTVTVSAGEGGSVSPTQATVTDGATQTFTVTPDSGYLVSSVTGCGGSLSGNTFTTGPITADCTVTAAFVLKPLLFTTSQPASVVIGQLDFTSSAASAPSASTVSSTFGSVAVVNGALYIADADNKRVLGFNAIPTTNGASADFVIGAADFVTQGTLAAPQSAASDGSRLFVAEYGGPSVAVYDPAPTANTSAPLSNTPQDVAFRLTGAGVGGFASVETVAVGGGKLVLTDTDKNRVLIWNTIPTSDTDPDLVLGQTDFTGQDPNQGLATPTASTLNGPAGIWTDGTRLAVIDGESNRVLIWNTWPTVNGQPADRVLGQPDFASGLGNQGGATPSASSISGPYDGVTVRGDQLFVCDTSNRRVLIWNSWPTVNGAPADQVLGAPDFTTVGGTPTATTMDSPDGVTVLGNQLVVTDYTDNRVLIFNGTVAQGPSGG